jgi:PAS domain S-box-containing protein
MGWGMQAVSAPLIRRYSAAMVFALLAFALRLGLDPWLTPEAAIFLPFVPAVALAVGYGGVGPAVLATLLGIAGASLVMAPDASLRAAVRVPLLQLLIYLVSCVVIIALGALAKRRGELAEQASRALQESERRNRFLVGLDDALRSIAAPGEIKSMAARLLGEHLDASHVAYQEFDEDEDWFTVIGDYNRHAPSLAGRYRLADFGEEARERLARGEPFVTHDIASHEPAPHDLGIWRRARIRAIVSVPLHKAGRLVAVISIAQQTPRTWSSYELELVPRVVSRCWESVERARAQQALQDSEAEFRALFELSTMGVAEADPQTGRFLRANQRFCDITGRDPQQILQVGFTDITHPDDRERDIAVVAPVLRGEAERWETDKRYVRPDGSVVWVIVSGRLITDRHGRPLRTIASVADVTARRQAEERLRDSERRFRVAQETSLMPFTIMSAVRDVAGDICDFEWIYANTAASRYLDLAPSELIGRSMLETLPEARQSLLYECYARVVETGEPHDMEILYRAEGGTRIFRNVASKLEDGVAAWHVDITEVKRMTAEVAASRSELRLVTDTAAVLLAHCDQDGRILFVNRAYADRFGREPEDLVGLVIGEAVEPETYRMIKPYVEQALAGQVADFEAELPHAQLGPRYMKCTYVPEVDGDGAVLGFVASLSDITDRRRLEEELRETDRRKDEFLATLAHELRNPLAPIRTAIDYIKLTGPAETGLRRAEDIIERQTALLTRLVDDLLDLSRLSRGRVALRREPVDLRIALQDSVETCRPLIDSAGQTLTVEGHSDPGTAGQDGPALIAHGDLARLSQVFSNLLNNAAKFTPPGGHITLSARPVDGEIVVVVRDDGAGFPPEAAQEIFEMFAQGPASAEHPKSGLGIGLTLVRQLVELHGGRVTAESDGPGKGSTFTVYLPASTAACGTSAPNAGEAARPSEDSTPSEATISAVSRRVLVCDDNEDAAMMLALLLRSAGHHVSITHDGVEAVAQTEALRPEVVILDIGMPRMDGYEAARRIRELPEGRTVRLIALTGWGQDKDKARAREAGFDEHLTKPVDGDVLQRIVAG